MTVEQLSRWVECPCFYFDASEADPTVCECGHTLDEHDRYLDCTALVEDV